MAMTMAAMVNAASSPIEKAPGTTAPSVPPRRPAKDRLVTPENLKKVLTREGPIADVNHYARLKVRRESPTPMIVAAFEERVKEVRSMEGIDDETRSSRLQELQESYEILTSVRDRRLYDWSLLRQLSEGYKWPYEADITQRYSGPESPPDEDYDEATKRLGYFFLAWIILSAFLSIYIANLNGTAPPYPPY